MELTETRKAWLIETAKTLKGYERRRFMARTVQELGAGGQRRAERELGWNRQTIRKAAASWKVGCGVWMRSRSADENGRKNACRA